MWQIKKILSLKKRKKHSCKMNHCFQIIKILGNIQYLLCLPSLRKSLTRSENIRRFSSFSVISSLKDPELGIDLINSASIETHCSLSTCATSRISSSSMRHLNKKQTSLEDPTTRWYKHNFYCYRLNITIKHSHL